MAFPKLNAFGIAFKQRGYRSEDEGPGGNVWDMKSIPLGAVAHMTYQSKDAGGVKTGRAEVSELEFFFGGVLAPNISFFGGVHADVAAGDPLKPGHNIFIIFDDIISESRLNLKVGRYHADFPFLSNHRSPTLSGYLVRINATGMKNVSLMREGAEVNGYFEETKTRYAVGVGNTTVSNAKNSLGAVHAWIAQEVELMGFDQTISVIVSMDKNGDEVAGTDDGTTAYGGVLDLHYGLTGVIIGYYIYNGSDTVDAGADIKSGLAELLHSLTETLVMVARFDYQDVDGSSAESHQYTGSLQYFFHPNVKAQAEYANLVSKDASGVDTDTKTETLALTVGF